MHLRDHVRSERPEVLFFGHHLPNGFAVVIVVVLAKFFFICFVLFGFTFHLCVYTLLPHECSSLRDQKRAMNPQELELR